MRSTRDFDLLLETYITTEKKLQEEDANLLTVKFIAVKNFLNWSKTLHGQADFHKEFKDKLHESVCGLVQAWEEQGISEDLQARFMKVHDANTNFWLKRMMIKSVFDYDACVDATYRLLQRTLSDYNKVKVMYTFAHLHSAIGGVA
tara:strand:+ start:1784 stop:2221 length:438 start_codon:yes stop_codon:yes gene_type:complete